MAPRDSIARSLLERGHHSVGRLHPGQPGDLIKILVKAGDDCNSQLLATKSDHGVMEDETSRSRFQSLPEGLGGGMPLIATVHQGDKHVRINRGGL